MYISETSKKEYKQESKKMLFIVNFNNVPLWPPIFSTKSDFNRLNQIIVNLFHIVAKDVKRLFKKKSSKDKLIHHDWFIYSKILCLYLFMHPFYQWYYKIIFATQKQVSKSDICNSKTGFKDWKI